MQTALSDIYKAEITLSGQLAMEGETSGMISATLSVTLLVLAWSI
jgi:hypothetical protein